MGYSAVYNFTIDLFILDTASEKSKTVFRANIGFGIDYMISDSIGIFAEFAYYMGGKVSGEWDVVLKKYHGVLGELTFTPKKGTVETGNYGWEVSTSFYKATAGIKICI